MLLYRSLKCIHQYSEQYEDGIYLRPIIGYLECKNLSINLAVELFNLLL